MTSEKKKAQDKSYRDAHKDEIAAKQKAYRASHQEEIIARRKTYNEAHREENKARCKAYYEDNREEFLAKCKVYNDTHKEQKSATDKAYRQAHVDELKAKRRAYYASHKEEIRAYRAARKEHLRTIRESNRKNNSVEIVCPQCGKHAWVRKEPNRVGKFCSEKCSVQWYIGSRTSNWGGGTSFKPYCPKFNERTKEEVREAFGRRCYLCGAPENGRHLDVHHCDYNKSQGCAGQRWSLIPLCRGCHTKTSNNRWYWFALLRDHWINHLDGVLEGIYKI